MHLHKIQLIFITYLLIFILATTLYGCGGGGGGGSSSSGNGSPQADTISPITIDNTGVVPVLNNTPTSSVVYVHNNTDLQINGISYEATVDDNVAKIGFRTKISKQYEKLMSKFFGTTGLNNSFLNQKTTTLCASIAPQSSCVLGFTTAAIGEANHGSAIITAHYVYAQKKLQFAQTINYAAIDSTTYNGVILTSGVQAAGYGNPYAYATVYAYGSGTQQYSTITSITTSSPNLKVVNGNITAQTMQPIFVQAIELSTPASNSQSNVATLTINSAVQNNSAQATNSSYSSQSRVTTATTSAASNNSTARNTTSAVIASPTSNFTYSNSTIVAPQPTQTTTFKAKVNLNNQSIIIDKVTASGAKSGDGSIDNPFIFSGSNPSAKYITVVYKNSGSNTIHIDNVVNNVSPALWSINNGNNGCSNTSLAASQACSITYTNLLAQNILAVANVGSSFTMDFRLPQIDFNDPTSSSEYSTRPLYNGANFISIVGQQATVANSVTVLESKVIVSHNLANAQGYSNGQIQITTSMEEYFTTNSPSSDECNVASSSGITTQNCAFANFASTGNEILNVTYSLDASLSSSMVIHSIFENINYIAETVFVMSSQYIASQLPNIIDTEE